jgi:hypothetical protein
MSEFAEQKEKAEPDSRHVVSAGKKFADDPLIGFVLLDK